MLGWMTYKHFASRIDAAARRFCETYLVSKEGGDLDDMALGQKFWVPQKNRFG